MLPLFGFLILLFLCGFFLFILAGYVLGRKKGIVFAAAVLLLPSVLDYIDLWPMISPSPTAFEVGGVGNVGDVLGTLFLTVLAVVIGWSIAILLIDCFCIRRRFWDMFNHFWLVFGLVAVIFFVFDANVVQHDREYSEAERNTQKASMYLLKQVDTYSQWCHEASQDDIVSCQWASGVHQTLLDDSFRNATLFGYFGPKSSMQLYGWLGQTASPEQKLAIRTEISAYNQMLCPVMKVVRVDAERIEPSRYCEETPAVFLDAWPEPKNGKVDATLCIRPVALASECLIPTLVYLHQRDADLSSRSENEHRSKNYRWMYYLFFSSVLGVKIAESTVKLMALDERTGYETHCIIRVVCRIGTTCFHMIRNFFSNFAWLLKRSKERLR